VAKFVATDYSITINGTSFSSSLAAATLDITVEEQDTTSFGAAGGYRTRIGGLKDASLSLDFHQDFGAASVDATLFPLLGTQATVVIKPTSGTATAQNPAYQFNCLVTQYQPFASSIGDLATTAISWPVSSEIVRGTA
jgi:predicted secreted protein